MPKGTRIDPRDIGFFCTTEDTKPLGWVPHCSLESIFEDFEEVVADGHLNLQTHCDECNSWWQIERDTPLFENLLEEYRLQRQECSELRDLVDMNLAEQDELDAFVAGMFNGVYKLNPLTECPKCHLKYFCTQEQVNRCKSEVHDAKFRITHELFRHEDYHRTTKTPCTPHLCDFINVKIPALHDKLNSLETKWASLHNRDAVVLSKQLVM